MPYDPEIKRDSWGVGMKFHYNISKGDLHFVNQFLARRDECPESYCSTPGIGVRVQKPSL